MRGLTWTLIGMLIMCTAAVGAGKGETTNVLNEWMDRHMVVTHAYGKPTKEERERPPLWRYWRDMPDSGQMSILLSSWYSKPLSRPILPPAPITVALASGCRSAVTIVN